MTTSAWTLCCSLGWELQMLPLMLIFRFESFVYLDLVADDDSVV